MRSFDLRDKLISVRVDSKLLSKFDSIVKSKTQVSTFYGRKIIEYEGRGTYSGGGKYSIADLLEHALEEYIKNNS